MTTTVVKPSLKYEFKLFQTLPHLFRQAQLVKCDGFFSGFQFLRTDPGSKGEFVVACSRPP